MSTSGRGGDIELDEDFTLQQRTWWFQRAGLLVMVLFVAAGLLGLLGGNGPLARARVEDPDAGIVVEYEQFLRRRASTALSLHLSDSSPGTGEVAVQLGRPYIDQFEIRTISPEPVRIEAGDTSMTYYFELLDGDQGAVIRFYLDPQEIGRTTAQIRIGEREPLRFWQFVYP